MVMSRKIKQVLFGLLVLLAVASSLPAEGADVDVGLRTGYYVGTDGPFLGMDVTLPMVPHLYFNPNVEFAFGDDKDTLSLNADAFISIPLQKPTFLFFGGGPSVLFHYYDNTSGRPGRPPHHPEKDDIKLGLNALAGVGWKIDNGLLLYFQGKFVLASDPEGVMSFGIRF